MIRVELSFANGQRQEVLLAGVPRAGESIRLSNGAQTPSLIVEHVLWMEGSGNSPEPSVIVVVRPRSDGDHRA